MPVGSGGVVKSVGVKGRKNRETVTASVCHLFAALVAPATATPDWSKGQKSSREQSVDNLSDRKLHSSLRGSDHNGIDFKS